MDQSRYNEISLSSTLQKSDLQRLPKPNLTTPAFLPIFQAVYILPLRDTGSSSTTTEQMMHQYTQIPASDVSSLPLTQPTNHVSFLPSLGAFSFISLTTTPPSKRHRTITTGGHTCLLRQRRKEAAPGDGKGGNGADRQWLTTISCTWTEHKESRQEHSPK